MRQRMECIRYAEAIERSHAGFFRHSECGEVREVRLIRERDEIEHHIQMLIEIVRNADRGIRKSQARYIALFHGLNAAFGFAYRVEIFRYDRAILAA